MRRMRSLSMSCACWAALLELPRAIWFNFWANAAVSSEYRFFFFVAFTLRGWDPRLSLTACFLSYCRRPLLLRSDGSKSCFGCVLCLGAVAPADAARWRLWTEGGLLSLNTQHRRNRAAPRLPAATEPVALVSSMVKYQEGEENEK